MKTMFARNGMCSAIEQVLTLPIRGAPYTIAPAKGDKGEAELVQSVLMTPNEDGGMKTPISSLVGQITSAQIFRRAFFLPGSRKLSSSGNPTARSSMTRSPTARRAPARPGTTTAPASPTGSVSRSGCSGAT
jgi:hypothetical protein